MGVSEVICSNCGSRYRLTSNSIPFRDKDSIDCQVCGHELCSWNQAKIYYAALLERHENHKPSEEQSEKEAGGEG